MSNGDDNENDDFDYTTTDLSHRAPDRFKKSTNESDKKPASTERNTIRKKE